MENFSTEIKFSRKKIIKQLLLPAILVALSCFAYAIAGEFEPDKILIVKIAGVGGILLFSLAFCFTAHTFFYKSSGLILQHEGFINNTGLKKERFTAWALVENAYMVQVYRNEILQVLLSPTGKNTTGKKISITANMLDTNMTALDAIFTRAWNSYKTAAVYKAAEPARRELADTEEAVAALTTEEAEGMEHISLENILGKRIKDILENTTLESYGMDTSESFLLLEDGVAITIPYHYSNAVWTTTIPRNAESIFRVKGGLNKQIKNLQNSAITDIIFYKDGHPEKALVALDNGYIITEIQFAMNGTGHAGLWQFASIAEMEKRYGKDYTRWSDNVNIAAPL